MKKKKKKKKERNLHDKTGKKNRNRRDFKVIFYWVKRVNRVIMVGKY